MNYEKQIEILAKKYCALYNQMNGEGLRTPEGWLMMCEPLRLQLVDLENASGLRAGFQSINNRAIFAGISPVSEWQKINPEVHPANPFVKPDGEKT